MTLGRKYNRVLDGRKCFELWYSSNSLYKVQTILASEGLINPKTGRVPTVMGISNAAWEWAIENQDEAKKLVQDVFRNNGELMDDDEWKKMLEKKIRYVFVKTKKRLTYALESLV